MGQLDCTTVPPGDHVCVLDFRTRGGTVGCRCGAWFTRLQGQLLTYAFVDPDLARRARKYGDAVRLGEIESLAVAVKTEARRVASERARKQEAREKYIRERAERLRNDPTLFMQAARKVLLGPKVQCAYCGGADPRTLDHVLPVSRWPHFQLDRENLVPACKHCNSQKGSKTPEEWKAARLARGLPWPPTQPQPGQ